MSLTPEQQQVLDALIGLMPRAGASASAPRYSAPNGKHPEVEGMPPGEADKTTAAQAPDFLEVWTGISADKFKLGLSALLGKKNELEDRLRDWTGANPLDACFEFLAACAWAFYRAEKGVNPKIVTYTDAFYYIATCASVGYADIFAGTQPGKAIASMVMIVGPAVTNKALDPPWR